MNTKQSIKRSTTLILALQLALLFGSAYQGHAWDYGDGRHGSFVLMTNATIEQLYQFVRLTNDPPQYDPANSNAVPNFQNLIITNSAMLTANAWNGTNGGWIVVKVNAMLSLAANSIISASGKGYRGGSSFQQGESYAGNPVQSTAANYGGGGGACASSCYVLVSGAGGGYALAGGNGLGGESGGSAYGTASLDTPFFGSGGGGGGRYGGAGGGGGVILIQAAHLQVYGLIQANGQEGLASANGGGGGGSGGSIQLLVATAMLGTNNVTALGGINSGNGQTIGGNGSVGRIMVGFAESYSGTTTPAAFSTNNTNSDIINITNQSASQSIFLGSNVLFNVGFATLSPYTMQWYFNGTAITGATNQSLSLVNLSLTNQGNYWLTIANLVMAVNSSNIILTILDTNMPFGDGIPNWWKDAFGLSTNNPTLALNYPSGDKLTYLDKYLYGLNPLTTDTDGDGLTDYAEIFVYHTNPLTNDTDGDGIPDGWEIQHGLNPLVNDATQIGPDGVSNLQIYQYDSTNSAQLDPRNPFFAPGTSIYELLNYGQHTNRFYYDHEDRLVGAEYSRGISIGYQYDGNENLLRQSVFSRASETNGLPLLWLWLNGLTNRPGIAYESESGNGWNNYQDWLAGADPNNSNSVPSLINNSGANIASLTLPFTPTNWVMAAGQLNATAGDELVVGADGNATGKTNELFILTHVSTWQIQSLPIGSLGITSIAVGHPANRSAPAIYVGLRQTGGTGAIWELSETNGLWQTNVLAVSTNESAQVLGVRSSDVLVSFATNGLDDALYSLTYSNSSWNQNLISTNTSHRGLGTHGLVFSHDARDASIRLLDTGGIEATAGNMDMYTDNVLLPQGLIQDPGTGKWHFSTPTAMSWMAAEAYFTNFHGNLSLPANATENSWLASHFGARPSWIGLYWILEPNNYWNPYYANATPAPTYSPETYAGYSDWFGGSPNCFSVCPSPSVVITLDIGYPGLWGNQPGSSLLPGIGELSDPVTFFTNQWLIPEPPATSRFSSRGLPLAAGLPRPNQTNSTSLIYAFADDQNLSGKLDAGDNFTLAEYLVSGNTWTMNTLFQVPITSANVAQSFSLAAVNFTGTGKDTLFTGEPDGRVYSWVGTDATSPLQRQLFSDAYAGRGWQAMCGVQMSAFGKGLAGLMMNPTNQTACNVILWPQQVVLPKPQPSLVETAPAAMTLPANNSLGSIAVVNIRLWDNEGNASTPFLQFQYFGSTNWQNATITTLDGAPYSTAVRVAAVPTGTNHTLVWNAVADLLAGTVTNVLLRANAQDFMLMGTWSLPVSYTVNTSVPLQIDTGSTNVEVTSQGFELEFTGMDGSKPMKILGSTNLIDWVPIFTNYPPFTDPLPFIDPVLHELSVPVLSQ